MPILNRKMEVLHVYSGGLDSTVLLYQLMDNQIVDTVHCVHFYYGSKQNIQERIAAIDICELIGVKIRLINLDFTTFLSDNLSMFENNIPIPDGNYNAENMSKTIVPFRNGILLSIAASIADNQGFTHISYAAHSGDPYSYPDCRLGFVAGMGNAIVEGTKNNITLLVPFLRMDKSNIVKIGKSLDVPFERTVSCYKGEVEHCGTCGACTVRKEAFRVALALDPTEYKEW